MKIIREIDIRRPLHAVIIGVLLAGIIAPVADYVVTNERYSLNNMGDILVKPSPKLKSKLVHDDSKRASIFNAEGETDTPAEAKDLLTAKVGAGDKKSTQLYTATLPDKASSGIVVRDNVNKVDVTFTPMFGTMDGRKGDGRVVYPLTDQAGMMVYTPKANGIKEDILLDHAPGDTAEYKYQLKVPDSLQARLLPTGDIGFYSGDPALFGNITYGTDQDRLAVEKARANADKTYLMFRIPAPVIKQSGIDHKTSPKAAFKLDGDVLTLKVTGLDKANYPLSIDPTFLITTTADFLLGSSDDNVDLSVADQVGRAALTGGSLTTWTQAANGITSNFAFGITAYNGCIYQLGGGNNAVATASYSKLSLTTGNTTQAWASTTAFNTGRVGAQAVGYNGYVYVFGGENATGSTQYNSVEYAKINSDCTLGTWSTTSSMNNARAFFASAIYRGVVYVMGGEQANLNATLTNTVEYARIKGDGSIGSWTTTTALTSARDRFSAAAYNGYVYVSGGLTNSTTTTTLLQYAPINSDGSLGSWTSGTSIPTARRDHGMGIERGHIYVYAGCTSGIACSTFLNDTEYAVVNADGSIGQWQQTNNMNNARDMMATTFYNGHIYSAGGCSNETNNSNNCKKTTGNVYFASFATPGVFDGLTAQANTPYNPTATGTARFNGQAAALNGYIYYIGGVTSTTGAAYTPVVNYAQMKSDGSLGAWGTTTSLPAQTGDLAGRSGHTVIAYKNKLYVIGGDELPSTAGNDVFLTSVISNTQNSNGTLSASWSNEASLPAARGYHASVLWNNYIYVLGGRDNNAVYGTVYYSQIGSGGTLGAWATASNGITPSWGLGAAVYGNYIYALSGSTNTTGTMTTAVQRATITSSGNVTSAWVTDTALPAARLYARALVQNNFIYFMGGTASNASPQTTIYWSAITPSTGAIASWSSTGVGARSYAGTDGLATARGGYGAVAASGYFYLIGGCSGNESVTQWDSCGTIITSTATTETEVYLINNGGTGAATGFTTTNMPALPAALADQASVAYNGELYELGGCNSYTAGACSASGNYLSTIYSAVMAADGSLGSWTTQATALPTAVMLEQAVVYNGYLYVIGGETAASGAVGTVSYAAISSTGTIGAFSSGTALPSGAERRNFGAAISNGYLYAAGGESATGTYKNDVYYAPVNSNGSIGSWNSTTAFTTARSGFGLVAYNGDLYVAGGNNGTALSDVQFAVANTDGTLPSWSATTNLQHAANARVFTAANGYFYALGDEDNEQQTQYAAISSNGTLGTLHTSVSSSGSASVMTAGHAHGAGAWFKGQFYVVGGCTLSGLTCTTVSSVAEMGDQDAISRRAHYSKLFDTQVDTSPTQLVLNGALSGPGSSTSVQFQSASSLDPVLGVAELIDPVLFGTYYNVQALNSSGVNVGVAKTYLLLITLDDAKAGTFPDTNQSGSQTAVTDITLYYHANPARRLRHGASFTDTGCNPTPANGCILDTAP